VGGADEDELPAVDLEDADLFGIVSFRAFRGVASDDRSPLVVSRASRQRAIMPPFGRRRM
jgi:hypothetical protein